MLIFEEVATVFNKAFASCQIPLYSQYSQSWYGDEATSFYFLLVVALNFPSWRRLLENVSHDSRMKGSRSLSAGAKSSGSARQASLDGTALSEFYGVKGEALCSEARSPLVMCLPTQQWSCMRNIALGAGLLKLECICHLELRPEDDQEEQPLPTGTNCGGGGTEEEAMNKCIEEQ